MANTRMATGEPPPFGQTEVPGIAIALRRDLRGMGAATFKALGFFNSGLVQVGVLCTLCLGAPEIARHGPLADAKSIRSCAELPAGRPGKRRQKELKQIPFFTEMTMKQPAYRS